MRNIDNSKLTFWGASPIIFIITTIYAIPISIINYFFKPISEINFIPSKILIALAIILLCIGIPLYILNIKGSQNGL